MTAASYYIPSRDEVDGFEELLAGVPAGALDQGLVASLAGKYWARKLAAGQSLRVGVTDEYGKRHEAELHPPAKPATPGPEAEPEPETTPAPLVPFSDLPQRIGDKYRAKLAMLEDPKHNPWGTPRSGGYIPDTPTPQGGYHGTVRAADGTILRGVGAQGVDAEDAQAAQAKLAAIPQYGQQGWQGGKRQALDVLGKATGQRAPLSPEKQAKLDQAQAVVEAESRAAFMAEVRQREAEGRPVTNYRELGQIAERHGHRL